MIFNSSHPQIELAWSKRSGELKDKIKILAVVADVIIGGDKRMRVMPPRLSTYSAEAAQQRQRLISSLFTLSKISTKRHDVNIPIQRAVSLFMNNKKEPALILPARKFVYIGQRVRINPLKSHCN